MEGTGAKSVFALVTKKEDDGPVVKKRKVTDTLPSSGVQVAPLPNDNSLTSFFTKYGCLIGYGMFEEPIFMLADSNMADDEYRVYKIPGLGMSNVVGSYARVVMAKTRCLNKQFFKWLIINVFVPFVETIRSANMDYFGDDDYFCFHLDGEKVQLDPFFDNEIVQLLARNRIIVVKVPASTTGINQACDSRHIFLALKTALRHVTKEQALRGKDAVEKRMSAMFREHNEWLNSDDRREKGLVEKGRKKKYLKKSDKSDAIEFDKSHERLAKLALLKFQYALAKTERPHMEMDSFEAIGVVPFNARKILNNCKIKPTAADVDNILRHLPTLAREIEAHGRIAEDVYDRCGIMATQQVPRNAATAALYKRRAEVISHPEIIAGHQAYLAAKATDDNSEENE